MMKKNSEKVSKDSFGEWLAKRLKRLLKKDYRSLIVSAGVFDPDYYLATYEDIRKAKVDPLTHYLNSGAKEGRNPNVAFDTRFFQNTYMSKLGDNKKLQNPLVYYVKTNKKHFKALSGTFDVKYYLEQNKDVRKAKTDPLAHYIHFGRKEGRKGCASHFEQKNTLKTVAQQDIPSSYFININNKPVSIIVPIYNAYEEVRECIFSLLENVDLEVDSIILLDDNSSDPRVKKLLSKLPSLKNLSVVFNDVNLGYTKNVNKGIDLAGDSDVILLNSDTRVTPFWVRSLKLAAYQNEEIGTVTAVSNGAGAFSVPDVGLFDLPSGFTEVEMSRLVRDCGPHRSVEVPTGNGFCLYIKRTLIDSIGKFDSKLFPRGYGEENYFCMRAIDFGFKNIVDPNCYVFHKRSASFKEEKTKLAEHGNRELLKVYSEYPDIIRMISRSTNFRKARASITEMLSKWKKPEPFVKPRILFVISTRTGGTPQTNLDLMRGIKGEFTPIALACNRRKIEVLEATKNGYALIEEFNLKDPINFSYHRSLEYNNILKTILLKYSIEIVHVRHLVWQSLDIFAVCKSLGVLTVNSFHDFYTVCPSVNLIDDKGNFHKTGVTVKSTNPLWQENSPFEYSEKTNQRWQSKMASVLKLSDAYVTTSQSAKTIIKDALPSVFENKPEDSFVVFPHGRDFSSFSNLAKAPEEGEPIRVLLPGNVNLQKGSEIVKALKKLDTENKIEFHLLGNGLKELKPYVVRHGSYERNQFAERVKAIQPHLAAILSICPETYCHTLTECWACGVPVVGINIGAVGERLAKHQGGWLVEKDVNKIFKTITEIDLQSWENKIERINQWQTGYGSENTIENMASHYTQLYYSLINDRQPKLPQELKRVGLVLKGRFPDVPPTAYVRMVDWKSYFDEKFNTETEFLNGAEIFKTNFCQFKELVVQRDAIPSKYVDNFIHQLSKHNVRLSLELDDDLLDVPESLDSNGIYEKYKSSLEKLLSSADCIHVTNQTLANKMKQFCQNVEIRPNKISKSRWMGSVNDDSLPKISNDENELNILFFGSRTHTEDYHFLLTSLEQLESLNIQFSLTVVGVTSQRDDTPSFVKFIDPPSVRYDEFVDWLKANKMSFDLGVAPLVESEFNKSKSHLKALEYLALGIPAFCSNVDTYQTLSSCEGVTLLDNEPEKWVTAFKNFEKRRIPAGALDGFLIEE
ncbi:glycosyltransferase [Alteromonas sp. ASW11-130]|uniref:glycosyltransferase n=1 Tax=Alteromonas sp. ASW11-130 TaxID=3015775 RepID=UPI0022422B33|nr:glycosyltransferase [Alteromonas sp. ASW11-130]MCW8090797.1 glycosyltransferase [Alteromonas sp. ASW11-130]